MLEYMTEKYIKELDSKKFTQPWKRKPKYHQVNLAVSPTKIDPATYYTRDGQEEKERGSLIVLRQMGHFSPSFGIFCACTAVALVGLHFAAESRVLVRSRPAPTFFFIALS